MSHTFNISIEKDLSDTLKEVKSTIIENGGTFKGTTNKGQFSGKTILGKIKGEYASLSDKVIKITITKKPFITPKSKVESEIRKFFS